MDGDDQISSELVITQMLLNVCSKLDWSKIDQGSKGFDQFRKMLIEVSGQESADNEDKTMDYLGKQLTEAWQRMIERSELRYMDFYAPRDFESAPSAKQTKQKEESKRIVSD